MDLNDAGPRFESELRAAGLDPDRLDPWEAWRAFKTWARQPVAGIDADTLYVQLGLLDPTDDLRHVTFIRHLEIADADGELQPVREIVCDLGYDAGPQTPTTDVELSSVEFTNLAVFFTAIEGRSDFQQAMALEPAGSLVTWSEL